MTVSVWQKGWSHQEGELLLALTGSCVELHPKQNKLSLIDDNNQHVTSLLHNKFTSTRYSNNIKHDNN